MGWRTEEMPRGQVIPWVLGALLTSAALFWFGTGFTPVAGLAFLAPLPVLLLAPRVSAATAAAAAWLAFLLGTTNSWALYLDSHDIPPPLAAVIVFGLSTFFMLAVLLFRGLLHRGRALLATLALPALWTGLLYLVSISNPAGITATLANAQMDVPLLVQTASVGGVWAPEFLILLLPAAVAALLAPGTDRAARLRTGLVTGAVAVLALGYGAVRLLGADESGPQARIVLVALNQPQYGTEVASPLGQQRIADYGREIARLAEPGGTSVAVLPETGFAADDTSLPRLLDPLTAVARAEGTDIVVGLVLHTGGRYYNTALVVPAFGGPPVAYHKWHERGPKFTLGQDLGYVPGTNDRVGLAVCMDVNFPAPLRDYAADEAGVVLLPAADEDRNGWQHGRWAALRGVENGLGIGWSGQRGSLMISDQWGRVRAEASTDGGSAAPFASAVASVPLRPAGPTPATVLGDWFAWVCLVLALGATVLSLVPRRRPEQGERPGVLAGAAG